MATYFMKCDCGEIVSVNVGDKICEDVLYWFQSYSCTNCGKAVEVDGVDVVPPEIEKAILEQEGTHELYLCNEKDRNKAKFLFKKMPDNMKKCQPFWEKKTDIIIQGTQNEVLLVKAFLEKRGINSYIKR